jgi:hypothetical protein
LVLETNTSISTYVEIDVRYFNANELERTVKTQQANPGGILAPDEVVGRDVLIARLWRVLEKRSLYVTAERRMGKTSIVRDKMEKSPPDGWTLIYLDVSKAVTPLQFIDALLHASQAHLNTGTKVKFGFSKLTAKLSGLDVKAGIGVKLPDHLASDWKTLLESLLLDLSEVQPRIVLALDELPLMLDAIKRRPGGADGEALIMELLDTLRTARQERDLRMIYTGSLGLHHVLTVLQEQGYQNDPINDMQLIDLDPLAHEDAVELARRLLRGEGIVCDDSEAVAAHLAQVTDGIPFYIQHLVWEIGLGEEQGTIALVDRCLKKRLTDPLDPWRLNYYEDRIDTHYPTPYRPIARAVLDQLAIGHPQTLQELTESIDPTKTERDIETVRKVMNLLGLDHYTTIEEHKYLFRRPFVQRIWRSRRGMGE